MENVLLSWFADRNEGTSQGHLAREILDSRQHSIYQVGHTGKHSFKLVLNLECPCILHPSQTVLRNFNRQSSSVFVNRPIQRRPAPTRMQKEHLVARQERESLLHSDLATGRGIECDDAECCRRCRETGRWGTLLRNVLGPLEPVFLAMPLSPKSTRRRP